jgi:glucose/arabinose dehydrogenase
MRFRVSIAGGAIVVGACATIAAASCGDGASTSTTAAGGATTHSTSASPTGASTGSGASTSGAGGAFDCTEPGGSIPPLKLTPVVSGLSEPAFVTSAPGDASTLYVVELDGRIQVVTGGAVVGTFLDASASVHPHGGPSEEWGLLGLAFHPSFATNGRFYVYYTDQNADNGLYEYARSAGDPMKADPTPTKHFAIPLSTNAYNHNGGMLAFGSDKMLYVGVGDTAVPPGPMNPAPDTGSTLGKILRVDVDSDTPPSGNLAGFVWDYGLRNPWRFSFDACKGDLYIGDVGESSWEEIDVEPAGTGKRDYGWPTMEGSHCENGGSCTLTGVSPAIDYSHIDGVSVIGGYVYRGAAIPALRGYYLYGDFGSRRVWALRYANGAATDQIELTSSLQSNKVGGIVSFGEDSAGNVYLVDIAGTIFRIDPA